MDRHFYDVIILGLGAMGSAAASHLAARGKRVLGLEQFRALHALGSSHGSSRIIRQAYFENPAYVPLLRRAYELWEKLQRGFDRTFLQLTGGLVIGPLESPLVRGAAASAVEHNLAHEILGRDALKRRFPLLAPRPDDIAVYESKAGFLRPELAIRAHLEHAARHNADLHFEEPVTHWRPHAGGVQVETPQGIYHADRLVIAPGAWAQDLLATLQTPFDVRRHVMCWFDPVAPIDLFGVTRFPVYIWDVGEGEVFYGFPAAEGPGDGVKVAFHSGGESVTAQTMNRSVSENDIQELRRCVSRFLPDLNGPVVRAETCMYTLTPDEHFVISLHPELSQVAVAAGFSGHGFKFASVVGEILADLVTIGTTQHTIDFLSPARLQTPPQSSPSRRLAQ